MNERLIQQLQFLDEIEKLKLVYRRNRTVDRSRFENSAEHSWNVALMALVLAEHADTRRLDLLKVVKMLLIHDLVEIHAGDTWIFDEAGAATQAEKETRAARELFGLLPADQAAAFEQLWHEFEARRSAEARFAASIDLLQPLANHLLSGSREDEEIKPTAQAVLARKRPIAESSASLWSVAQSLIERSREQGLYLDEAGTP